MTTIIDQIYSHLPAMTTSDQKIANVILHNPETVVNMTISELSEKAKVSAPSVTRFCRNLNLVGFHELKSKLAQVQDEPALKEMTKSDLDGSLKQIAANKVAEIEATLDIDPKILKKVLAILKNSRVIQVAAQGDTYPVASDAVYKFNQLGMLAISAEMNELAIAQTMNLNEQDCLLVISNSGEATDLLKEIKIAKDKKVKVIAITNREDSPIALASDYHLKTGVRQTVLQMQYFFSRVSAFTMIEALFLLLINSDNKYVEHIRRHEEIISDQKV